MYGLNSRQRGLSFSGFIVGAFVLILVSLLGFKTVPAYIHNAQISQIFREIAGDPAMRTANISEIEMSYRKRANINYINDLPAENIDIVREEGGNLVLSAEYEVRIKLFGNITLLLEFSPSSS